MAQFEEELRKLIRERMETEAANLISGSAPDYATYRGQSGVIHGLDLALGMFEEAADNVRKQNR